MMAELRPPGAPPAPSFEGAGPLGTFFPFGDTENVKKKKKTQEKTPEAIISAGKGEAED